MKNFVPLFLNRYNTLSQHKEAVNILFQSQLINNSLDNLLTKSIEKTDIFSLLVVVYIKMI